MNDINRQEKIISGLRELLRQKDSVIADKEKIIKGYEKFIRDNLKEIRNGRIIIMTDNTNFRGYWIGTQHFLANMIFYSHLMN